VPVLCIKRRGAALIAQMRPKNRGLGQSGGRGNLSSQRPYIIDVAQAVEVPLEL